MSKCVRISNLLVSILTLIFAGNAQTSLVAETQPSLKITVRVYNVAKVSGGTLDQGEKEASRIFRDAGIALAWRECPCPQKLGPADLMLRINPRVSGSMRSYFGNGDLGFAPWDSQGGVLASIFYHRVEALSKGDHTGQLLGHVIARELGHLLLGANAHTSAGIMRHHWSREDLRLVTRGLFRFSSEQARLLRAHVSERIKQEEELFPVR